MKTTFYEAEQMININIEPETIEEVALLLRYSRNANSEKPNVYFNFRKDISCDIYLGKRKKSVQKFNVTPDLK